MIPAEFDYVAASSVEEAVQALRDGGEDAKVLAGGHSLIPLMKLRLAAPTLLVDLRRVQGLRGITRENGSVRIGALTTHHEVAVGGLGLASAAASTIADQQVRNRGTIGGTLAHGDPASDLPAILLAMEGTVETSAGRTIPAAELFEDYLTTSLAPDEIITSVSIPAPEGWGFGYEKFNRRQEDWAMVAVGAMIRKAPDGSCEDVRIGLTHMAGTPIRAAVAEEVLRGSSLDEATIKQAADFAAEDTDPPADLNASGEYKQHLARVLCRRALQQAIAAG